MNNRLFESCFMQMYNDRMDIYRYEKKVNADGSTQITREKAPWREKVPCMVSYKYYERKNQRSAMVEFAGYRVKLFCPAETAINEGDFIVVFSPSRALRGKAEKVMPFKDHCEIVLDINKKA